MTVTINSWFAWGIAALALFGVVTILYLVSGVLERLGDWWRDRGGDGDDYTDGAGGDDECEHEYTLNEAGTYEGCQMCDSIRPLALPPERSWEELSFTGPQPAIAVAHYHDNDATPIAGGWACYCDHPETPDRPRDWTANRPRHSRFAPARERWAPAWEAEARSAYQALDLDYPSGLLARVREAGQ